MPYTFTREPRTVRSDRVSDVQINPEWAAALDAEWEAHKVNPEVNHVVVVPENEVTRHASHAVVWGKRRPEGDQVTVRKLPNRKDGSDAPGTLRLSMERFDPNAPKRGRKPNSDPNSKASKAETKAAKAA